MSARAAARLLIERHRTVPASGEIPETVDSALGSAFAVSRSFITSVLVVMRRLWPYSSAFTKIVFQLSALPCARVFFVAFAERSTTPSCRQSTQQIQ